MLPDLGSGFACEDHYSELPSSTNSGASIRSGGGRIVSFDHGTSSPKLQPADLREYRLNSIDEAVDNAFAARFVEVDRQLVSIDLGNLTVPEFLVEDPLPLLK